MNWIPAASALQWGWNGLAGVALAVVLAIGCVALAVIAYRDTEPALTPARRGWLTLLRAGVLLLVLALLAEPVLHTRREIDLPPSLTLLLDDSGSMGIDAAGQQSRLQSGQQLRARMSDTLVERGDGQKIYLGQGSRRLLSSRLAEESNSVAPSVGREGTDLAGLLLSASQRHLEDNLRGIVLFSDGTSTVDDPPSLAGLDVPVYTVAVGDTVGPVDLRLERVRAPTLVHRGERAEIRAELVASGGEALDTVVQLVHPDGAVDSLTVALPEGGGRRELTFTVSPDSIGLRAYEIRVAARENEALLRNNAAIAAIQVRKEKLRVVHFQGTPDWNVHFMARSAGRDARFEYEPIHRSATGFRSALGDSAWTPPQSAEAAKDVDLWVAGSFQDLERLVEAGVPVVETVRAGAGLLVLAGEPGPIRPQPVSSELGSILPLRPGPGARWEFAKHSPVLTARGRSHPVFALKSRESLDDQLRAMPPLWGVVEPQAVASDADVLLSAAGPRERQPILALRQEGTGRVACWTGGPLWSWSFWRLGDQGGEEFFHEMVSNLLFQLAEGSERQRMRLLLPGPVLSEGQDAELRALALDAQYQPDGRHDVWLEWTDQSVDDPNVELEPTGRSRMELDPNTPGGRRLPMPALRAGRYSLRVALEEGSDRVVSDWEPIVVDPYSVEFRNPRVDLTALNDIATRTGGRILRHDELEDWARQVDLHEKRAILSGRIDLWSSLWLFLPLLALLSLEWALRKRWGLI